MRKIQTLASRVEKEQCWKSGLFSITGQLVINRMEVVFFFVKTIALNVLRIRSAGGIQLLDFWDAKSRTFAIVKIKIRGTYFDRRFGCWGSAAIFRKMEGCAQGTSTRLQAVWVRCLVSQVFMGCLYSNNWDARHLTQTVWSLVLESCALPFIFLKTAADPQQPKSRSK